MRNQVLKEKISKTQLKSLKYKKNVSRSRYANMNKSCYVIITTQYYLRKCTFLQCNSVSTLEIYENCENYHEKFTEFA